MSELTIFTNAFIQLRCLTPTSSDNCFCKSSILDVWHGFDRLNIFSKSSSWDIWHIFHPLTTFAKSFILDVRYGFHLLTVFVKCSIIDLWQRFNPLIISAKGSILDVWVGLHPLTTFGKSVICFRKKLYIRCLILDILSPRHDNKLTVNYVKNLLQSPWTITTSMKSTWK